jgi:hypothetical protein
MHVLGSNQLSKNSQELINHGDFSGPLDTPLINPSCTYKNEHRFHCSVSGLHGLADK